MVCSAFLCFFRGSWDSPSQRIPSKDGSLVSFIMSAWKRNVIGLKTNSELRCHGWSCWRRGVKGRLNRQIRLDYVMSLKMATAMVQKAHGNFISTSFFYRGRMTLRSHHLDSAIQQFMKRCSDAQAINPNGQEVSRTLPCTHIRNTYI